MIALLQGRATAIIGGLMGLAIMVLIVVIHFRDTTIRDLRTDLANERAAHAITRQSYELAMVKIEQQNADVVRMADAADLVTRRAAQEAERVRQANASTEALAARLERNAKPAVDGRCNASAAYMEARGKL